MRNEYMAPAAIERILTILPGRVAFSPRRYLDKDPADAGQGEREEQKHDPAREPPVLNATPLKSDKDTTRGSCEEHSAYAIEFLERKPPPRLAPQA